MFRYRAITTVMDEPISRCGGRPMAPGMFFRVVIPLRLSLCSWACREIFLCPAILRILEEPISQSGAPPMLLGTSSQVEAPHCLRSNGACRAIFLYQGLT